MTNRPDGFRWKMVFASSKYAGMTFLMTSSMRSWLICSLVTVLVVLRGDEHGVHALADAWRRLRSCTRSVTCVLPSGRTHGQVPFLRTSVSL